MILCEQINFIDYIEGQDPSDKIKQHLTNCSKCRKKLDESRKLLGILTIVKKKELLDDVEPDSDIPDKPLPESIKKLVKQRKESWLEKQAAKTADGLGYEEGNQKNKIIKLITQRKEDVFLNAAFSDDLLKGKRKETKESKDSKKPNKKDEKDKKD
ncbi:MAG: hypothetical protein K8S18_15620 [Desulfobacula sp.]|nr:hypothetical protein [Desulfobacula sp.]